MRRKKTILLCLIPLFFLLSFFVFVFVFLRCRSINNSGNTVKSEYLYQLSIFDPSSNSTSYGVAYSSKILKKDEMISYFSGGPDIHNNNKKFIMISNFFKDEYECSADCVCSNSNSRRTTSSILMLHKGLFFAVSAISLTMAISVSHKYFQEECIRKFGEYCDDNSSPPTTTTMMMKETRKKQPRKTVMAEALRCAFKDKDGFGEKEKKSKKKYYDCHGHCTKNPIVLEGMRKERLKVDVSCESHTLRKRIEVEIDLPDRSVARKVFREEYLRSFCKQIQKVPMVKKNEFGVITRKKVDVCTADQNEAFGLYNGKNVICNFY